MGILELVRRGATVGGAAYGGLAKDQERGVMDALRQAQETRAAENDRVLNSIRQRPQRTYDPSRGALINETTATVEPLEGLPAAPAPRVPNVTGPGGVRVPDLPGAVVEPDPAPRVPNVTGPGGIRVPDVPGAKVEPPASQSGAPSQRQQATYKAQSLVLKNLKDAISTYRTHLNDAGVEVMPGGKKSSLEATHANLILQAKEAAKLGVLAGPDMGILEKLVNDPTSMKSAALNVLTLGNREGAMKDQLDTFESIIDGYKNRLDQTYGPDTPDTARPATVTGKAKPTQSQYDAARLTHSDADLAKYYDLTGLKRRP